MAATTRTNRKAALQAQATSALQSLQAARKREDDLQAAYAERDLNDALEALHKEAQHD